MRTTENTEDTEGNKTDGTKRTNEAGWGLVASVVVTCVFACVCLGVAYWWGYCRGTREPGLVTAVVDNTALIFGYDNEKGEVGVWFWSSNLVWVPLRPMTAPAVKGAR